MLSDQMKDLNLQVDELHKIKVQLEKDIQKNELTFKYENNANQMKDNQAGKKENAIKVLQTEVQSTWQHIEKIKKWINRARGVQSLQETEISHFHKSEKKLLPTIKTTKKLEEINKISKEIESFYKLPLGEGKDQQGIDAENQRIKEQIKELESQLLAIDKKFKDKDSPEKVQLSEQDPKLSKEVLYAMIDNNKHTLKFLNDTVQSNKKQSNVKIKEIDTKIKMFEE